MHYYTDPRLLDTSKVVQGLPELKGRGEAAERVTLKRTGTDDLGAGTRHIEDAIPTVLIRESSRPDWGGGIAWTGPGKTKTALTLTPIIS